MRNSNNVYIFILCIFLFMFSSCGSGKEFVKIKDTRIMLNNKPFSFSGTNQYYLFYKSHKMIDDVIESTKTLNMTVIRTWAFCEGSMHDDFCFQPSPRNYDEATFQNLDYTIYKAKKTGIRLILTLSNNWGDFGGVDQYLRWFNNYNHDDFFRNEEIKNVYKDYVKHVLNRVNTYTGVAYKDEPTIFMWELMNEPRCSDASALYRWIDEMAGYIKSIDPNHLVSTGSEGTIASDFIETHKSKNIDVASFHLYPDWWGFSEQQAIEYIEKHGDIANNILNKPVFLGEFGLKDRQRRMPVFEKWYSTAYEHNVNGMLFWILAGKQNDGSLYPDYDGFTIWCPESGAICDSLKKLSTTLFYP